MVERRNVVPMSWRRWQQINTCMRNKLILSNSIDFKIHWKSCLIQRLWRHKLNWCMHSCTLITSFRSRCSLWSWEVIHMLINNTWLNNFMTCSITRSVLIKLNCAYWICIHLISMVTHVLITHTTRRCHAHFYTHFQLLLGCKKMYRNFLFQHAHSFLFIIITLSSSRESTVKWKLLWKSLLSWCKFFQTKLKTKCDNELKSFSIKNLYCL